MLGSPKVVFSARISFRLRFLKQLLLVVLWCTEVSSGRVQKVKIIRSNNGQVDRIRLPKQLCGMTRVEDMGCAVMQKRKAQSCLCTCNKTNTARTSYVKTTAGYHNGSWQCWDNSQVRQYAGCTLLSPREAITDPIQDISRQPYVLKIPPKKRCRVNTLESEYLKCNGTWKLLRETVLRRAFNTSRKFTRHQVAIEYNGTSGFHHTINGRIIRLVVHCRKQKKNTNTGCIVLKVKGKMRCSVKPTGITKVKSVIVAATNVSRKPESPLLKPIYRPRLGASKSNIRKEDKEIDETVAKSLAITIGAFVGVLLVLVAVLVLVVRTMRRK